MVSVLMVVMVVQVSSQAVWSIERQRLAGRQGPQDAHAPTSCLPSQHARTFSNPSYAPDSSSSPADGASLGSTKSTLLSALSDGFRNAMLPSEVPCRRNSAAAVSARLTVLALPLPRPRSVGRSSERRALRCEP